MSLRVGRILRFVGVALLILLILELIVLSPRLYRSVTGSDTNTADANPVALPTANPDLAIKEVMVEGKTVLPTLEPTFAVIAVAAEPTALPTPTLRPTEIPTSSEEDVQASAEAEEVAESQESDDADVEAEANSVAEVVTPVPAEASAIAPLAEIPTSSEATLERADAYSINSILYQSQERYWTHAGPAVTAMVMTYWGQTTSKFDVGAVVYGSAERFNDVHATPDELVSYINASGNVSAISRQGGSLELLRQLVHAGFPVIIQKSFPIPGNAGWSGHYLIVSGYNDGANTFQTFDPYVGQYQNYGENQIEDSWRALNFSFIVAYNVAKEAEMLTAISEWANEAWSIQRAHAVAASEASELGGLNQFFAQYNLGTNLTAMKQYEEAAAAFDTAFELRRELQDYERPVRMLWYQFDAYEAYYRTGRYQRVIDLATKTIDSSEKVMLEESYFWRGKSAEKLNDSTQAQSDLAIAYELNPTFVSIDVDK